MRLAHVSPDAGPVDVTVEGTNMTLFDNATFGNATDYVEVPGGDYTLEVRPATADDDGTVVTTVDVGLENDTTYTAFAAGYLDPVNASGDEPFDLLITTDSDDARSGSDAGSVAATPPSESRARTIAAN